MTSVSLGRVTPVGRRTTLTTRFTSASSRHSSSTPCPTMPVAPNRTTFMSGLFRAGRFDRDHQLEAVVARGARRRLDEHHGVAMGLFRAFEPHLDALALVLWVVLDEESVEGVSHVAVDLLFDLLELLIAGAPGPPLDHRQHHL